MLKYKKGDLIKAAKEGLVDVIAHQCNCFCNMGKGIAPQIKKAFPEAWEADLRTAKGDIKKLGLVSHATNTQYTKPVQIYNLYGQFDYKKVAFETGICTDYSALRSSLQLMALNLKAENYITRPWEIKIGLPKIGAGLGGGDWEIISKIIEEELSAFDVTIYELI